MRRHKRAAFFKIFLPPLFIVLVVGLCFCVLFLFLGYKLYMHKLNHGFIASQIFGFPISITVAQNKSPTNVLKFKNHHRRPEYILSFQYELKHKRFSVFHLGLHGSILVCSDVQIYQFSYSLRHTPSIFRSVFHFLFHQKTLQWDYGLMGKWFVNIFLYRLLFKVQTFPSACVVKLYWEVVGGRPCWNGKPIGGKYFESKNLITLRVYFSSVTTKYFEQTFET